jgi:peptide/nickel transport system permease protein
MHRYVARRLLLFIPTLLLGTLLIFTVMRVLPGDLAMAILGAEATETGGTIDPQRYRVLRESLGLNDPLPVQYGKWVWSMVNGEFGGHTLLAHEPIAEVIALRFPKTAQLAIMAFTMSIIIGIPLGVVAALYQDKWPDYLIRIILVGGLSIPSFWLAMLILLGLLLWFNWVPPIAYVSIMDNFWANMQIMFLPSFIIAFHSATLKARVTRATMLEVMRQDYIRTAYSKGLARRLVLSRHALRNAMIPVVTIAGLNLTALFGGTVILESIFGIPGMGTGMIEGVRTRDYPLVQSLGALFLFITMIGNLIVDLSYGWLDPRVKYS